MPTQIEKLEAYASHLLDAFLLLRERYAMLAPMLFDKTVVDVHGARERARGLETLKTALFLTCAQDIAKLAMDDDGKTPSIRNLVRGLTDAGVRGELRRRHAAWAITPIDSGDPEVVAALKRMQDRDHVERGERFDELYCELVDLWARISTSPQMKAFQTVRDKVSAHTEVRQVADKYQFVDVSELGLKWGDLQSMVEVMQRMVDILGLLVRSTGFAWEMHDEQLARASEGFWSVPSTK